jgi:hypothetical protein
MALTVTSQCGNCQFFEKTVGLQPGDLYAHVKAPPSGMIYGVCRRYPPVPSARINEGHHDLVEIMGRWPLVPSDLWCGEWMEELA